MKTTVNSLSFKGGQMNFTNEELIKLFSKQKLPIITSNINYWFIRTSGGENFENFYFGNYVAIGWDEINDLNDITNLNFDDLKKTVEELYPEDTRPGSTAAQIRKFVCEINIGDYILIPGYNCDRIAIGIVTSEAYVYEPTEQQKIDSMFDGDEITFRKRHNVSWIADRPFDRYELDPMLIPIIYSYGTIVCANPYSDFINRTLYSCYLQDNQLHAIFDVSRQDNVPVYDFYNFIDTIFESIDIYNQLYDTPIDKKDFSIKASINSPGPVEIITCATSAFIVLSSIALFINGAKVKFSFDIFNIVKGEVDIDSPGLIDKLNQHSKIANDNQVKITEVEAKLNESKKKLKLEKKKNKK